jgi:hypothetical protein
MKTRKTERKISNTAEVQTDLQTFEILFDTKLEEKNYATFTRQLSIDFSYLSMIKYSIDVMS